LSPENKKRLLAAGVAAALVVGLVTGALVNFMASDGATIKFKTVKTEGGNFLFKSTKVGIVWSVESVGHPGSLATAVRVLETDDITITELTSIGTLNNTTVHPTKIKGDHEFVVETGLEDSSDINLSNEGKGVIGTSFDQQLNAAVLDVTTGFADIITSAAGGLFDGANFGMILLVIIVIVIFVVAGPILMDMFAPTSSK
jgi:hypothetical protein